MNLLRTSTIPVAMAMALALRSFLRRWRRSVKLDEAR
jgi:hypothetical protein